MEFVYNNVKNACINNMLLKLNYGYYFYISFEDKVDPYLRYRLANKLIKKAEGFDVDLSAKPTSCLKTIEISA